LKLPVGPDTIPSGSLLVFDAKDPRLENITSTMGWPLVQMINGVGGQPAAAVLRKN
jgi:hypothetical protein